MALNLKWCFHAVGVGLLFLVLLKQISSHYSCFVLIEAHWKALGDSVLVDRALLARASLSAGLQPHDHNFSEEGKRLRYFLLDSKSISTFKTLLYGC